MQILGRYMIAYHSKGRAVGVPQSRKETNCRVQQYERPKILEIWFDSAPERSLSCNSGLVWIVTKELLVGPHRKFVASIAFCYPLSKEGIIWLARLSQVIRSVLTLEVTMIHYQFLKADNVSSLLLTLTRFE